MKLFYSVFLIIIFNINTFSQNKDIPCDSSLWKYVYNSKRLEVIEECVTVTGIIYSTKKGKGGDIHIQLKPDLGQKNLLNDNNYIIQDSCLVIKPIRINEVNQINGMETGADYINHITIPQKGQHVRVTGSYVLDEKHMWREIYPITRIQIIEPIVE